LVVSYSVKVISEWANGAVGSSIAAVDIRDTVLDITGIVSKSINTARALGRLAGSAGSTWVNALQGAGIY
jgi:hypothetical protein